MAEFDESNTPRERVKQRKAFIIPGEGIVEGVEEERVVAMSTSDPAHPRHLRAKCHFD